MQAADRWDRHRETLRDVIRLRLRRHASPAVAAHARLIETLASYSDAELLEPTKDSRNRSAGAGVGKDVLLHGLAQHHAYHGGQIALLKKLV